MKEKDKTSEGIVFQRKEPCLQVETFERTQHVSNEGK